MKMAIVMQTLLIYSVKCSGNSCGIVMSNLTRNTVLCPALCVVLVV